MNLSLKKLRKEVGWIRLQFKELPFKPLEEFRDQGKYVEITSNSTIIPLDCYLTWEENSFGKNHRKELKNFISLNSDIRFFFFDAEARDDYMNKNWGGHEIYKVYNLANIPIIKADIFRYCILFDRGGFYFDINKKYPVALKDLISEESDFLFFYDSDYVNLMSDLPPSIFFEKMANPFINIFNGFFGVKKNHLILKEMIGYITKTYPLLRGKTFENPKSAVSVFTGPWAFTKIIFEHYAHNHDKARFSFAPLESRNPSQWYMKGSEVRFKQSESYAALQNKKILN